MVKILSNFDTELKDKLLKESYERYGEENVIFVRRDYIFFVFRVIIPVTIWICISLVLLYVMYLRLQGTDSTIGLLRWIGWICIAVIGVYVFHRILFAVLDYYLDFSIITPTQITNYNQTGFFGKSTRSLDLAKIKSVRVDQQGIMRSLWNYGSIVFLSEGDRQDLGDITLDHITNPNKLRDSITELMERNDVSGHHEDE